MDAVTLVMAQSYTDETVQGMGALKGKNCTVKGYTAREDGVVVTFLWTKDNGTEVTTDVLISHEQIAKLVDTSSFAPVYIEGTFTFDAVSGEPLYFTIGTPFAEIDNLVGTFGHNVRLKLRDTRHGVYIIFEQATLPMFEDVEGYTFHANPYIDGKAWNIYLFIGADGTMQTIKADGGEVGAGAFVVRGTFEPQNEDFTDWNITLQNTYNEVLSALNNDTTVCCLLRCGEKEYMFYPTLKWGADGSISFICETLSDYLPAKLKLKLAVGGVTMEVVKVDGDYTALQEEVEQLQEDTAKLNTDIEQFQNDLTQTNERIDQANIAIEQMENVVEQAEIDIDQLQIDVEDLKNKKDVLSLTADIVDETDNTVTVGNLSHTYEEIVTAYEAGVYVYLTLSEMIMTPFTLMREGGCAMFSGRIITEAKEAIYNLYIYPNNSIICSKYTSTSTGLEEEIEQLKEDITQANTDIEQLQIDVEDLKNQEVDDANIFIVSCDLQLNEDICQVLNFSHTFNDIAEAINAGKIVYCIAKPLSDQNYLMIFPLFLYKENSPDSNDGSIIFECSGVLSNAGAMNGTRPIFFIYVLSNDTVLCTRTVLKTIDENDYNTLQDRIGKNETDISTIQTDVEQLKNQSGGDGGECNFIITCDLQENVDNEDMIDVSNMSHTFNEVKTAIEAGKIVYCVSKWQDATTLFKTTMYQFDGGHDNTIQLTFGLEQGSAKLVFVLYLYENGNNICTKYDVDLATTESLNQVKSDLRQAETDIDQLQVDVEEIRNGDSSLLIMSCDLQPSAESEDMMVVSNLSHTFAQIEEAINSGKIVYCISMFEGVIILFTLTTWGFSGGNKDAVQLTAVMEMGEGRMIFLLYVYRENNNAVCSTFFTQMATSESVSNALKNSKKYTDDTVAPVRNGLTMLEQAVADIGTRIEEFPEYPEKSVPFSFFTKVADMDDSMPEDPILKDVAAHVPANTRLTIWINKTTAYPTIYETIEQAADRLEIPPVKEGQGAFGFVTFERLTEGHIVTITWEHYRTNDMMRCKYSDLNGKTQLTDFVTPEWRTY